VILFDTLMGKGVPFLEQREKNHFIRVDPPEWQEALDILDQNQATSQSEGARHEQRHRREEAAPDDLRDDRVDRVGRAAREGRALRQGAGRVRRVQPAEVVGLTRTWPNTPTCICSRRPTRSASTRWAWPSSC
jgi:hypothetical protein